MVTTDIRTIQYRTKPESRKTAAATLEAARQAEYEKLEAESQAEYDQVLRQLDAYTVNPPTGGRPLLWLPPEIAQRVLADVDAGIMSLCAIERKYKPTRYRFSRRWLADALEDGRLRLMADRKAMIAA